MVIMFRPVGKQVSSVKLDFKDVLLIPKGISHIESRKHVGTMTTVKFKNSKQEWRGTPIFTSNMDSTGTLQMYDKIHNMGNYYTNNLNIQFYHVNYFSEEY